MKCWICNGEPDSGEHSIKASDLKQTFGQITQKSPLFSINTLGEPITVGSIKSNKLKFEKRICSKCNTARTQPHDLAWQKLSGFVKDIQNNGSWVSAINIRKIFEENCADKLLNVHLYFNKIMGCRIVESGVPVDTKKFSEAILNNNENSELRLSLNETKNYGKPYCQLSELKVMQYDNAIVGLVFYYTVDRFHVGVEYTPTGIRFEDNNENNFWLPSEISDRIEVHRL